MRPGGESIGVAVHFGTTYRRDLWKLRRKWENNINGNQEIGSEIAGLRIYLMTESRNGLAENDEEYR